MVEETLNPKEQFDAMLESVFGPETCSECGKPGPTVDDGDSFLCTECYAKAEKCTVCKEKLPIFSILSTGENLCEDCHTALMD